MHIVTDHARNGKSSKNTFICWKCLLPADQRRYNKSGLCKRCQAQMIEKIVEQKRRARQKGNDANLTTAQWSRILYLSRGYCFYCRKHIGYSNLVMEHRIPIVKGGGTTIENVVPACSSCNSKKGAEVWG